MRLSLEGALRTLPEDRSAELTANRAVTFTAFDTSDLVNQCYRLNFPGCTVRQVNIESLKMADLDGAAEIWTMSPPCQPFTTTQNSKQLDMADNRNKAFIFLMDKLENLANKPEWIFFENVSFHLIYFEFLCALSIFALLQVKGFQNSESHARWIECLRRSGYSWRQYLLSPLQFRVPNCRTRFYMAIHLRSKGEIPGFSNEADTVYDTVEPCPCELVKTVVVNGHQLSCGPLSIAGSIGKVHELGEDDITGPEGINSVLQYTEPGLDGEELEKLLIPDETLRKKWAAGLSIVGVEDRCTFCFTSAYGRVRAVSCQLNMCFYVLANYVVYVGF